MKIPHSKHGILWKMFDIILLNCFSCFTYQTMMVLFTKELWGQSSILFAKPVLIVSHSVKGMPCLISVKNIRGNFQFSSSTGFVQDLVSLPRIPRSFPTNWPRLYPMYPVTQYLLRTLKSTDERTRVWAAACLLHVCTLWLNNACLKLFSCNWGWSGNYLFENYLRLFWYW